MTDPVFTDVQNLRALALAYLDLATDEGKGRGERDALYKIITERRDWGKGYSSCGDLCHWLLYRLGVREAWVNREEHRGWKVGVNVARLMWGCLEARAPKTDERFQPGDILGVWNKPDGTDAHVLVVRAHVGGHVHSADYGQPGGERRTRVLSPTGMLGERRVQRVIPFADALHGANKRGNLAPAQDLETWLTSVGPKGGEA